MASWLVVQTRLEEYLTLADVLAVDMVEITEKSREKDRRQVTREEKILQQKEEHVSLISAVVTSSMHLLEQADFLHVLPF